MDKLITAAQAAAQIPDGATVATGGFIGIGFAEAIAKSIEKRFIQSGHPRALSLIYAAGQGDGAERGLNHFAYEAMLDRVIGGHWGLAPKLGQLAINNKIEAYNLPQGVICHLFRDIAAGKPGTLTKVGLNTFVDPQQQGGKINDITAEDIVSRVELNDSTYLFYKAFPIDIAILRGTTADASGNITMEREALPLESLAIAQAVRNSGGKVFVQVERICDKHVARPDAVKIPGILVDHVVLADPEDHPQTFSEPFNPLYTGELIKQSPEEQPIPLDARKVIARRAFMALKAKGVINLGIGLPEMISKVAAEEGCTEDLSLTVEPGGIGGTPAAGLSFGAVANADAIVDQCAQFDFYDGGGLDQAFLGFAEISSAGDVNVSKFGSKLAGAGGFINITQNTPDLYFLGTFTSGKQQLAIENNLLKISSNGTIKKFCTATEQITFNGQYALQQGQTVTYITERAVFKLTEAGITITEIAPGVDLEKDILRQMEFTPIISDSLKRMDRRLFNEGKMYLQYQGSIPIDEKRELLRRAVAKYDKVAL